MSSFVMFNLTGVRAMLTPIFTFKLFNLMASVEAMLTLVLLFMLLDHASIRAIFNLVLEIVMIYILVLIWKLPNYLT